ncbi:MAG: CHRD domain-containing protein [Actinomycetes bacterium]
MSRRAQVAAVAVAALVVTAAATAATAQGDGDGVSIRERLSGLQEDPMALSTSGHGRFKAHLVDDGQAIQFKLSYAALEGDVAQAHIHLGNRSQSGGISVFLCTNVGGGTAATPACPPAPGKVTGTLRAADVIGPAGQGIAAGEFDELVTALRAGTTYVNVHSAKYPGGEIRGQLDD